MEDHDLIAAVAKRLKWTHDGHGGYGPIGGRCWDGKVLPSIDAALGVLSQLKNPGLMARIEYYPHISFVDLIDDNHDDPIASADDKSLSRAILLAFLESQEEKP